MIPDSPARYGHPYQCYRSQGATLEDTGGDPLRCQLIETGGGLSLTVLWDRCMDVGQLSYRGCSIPFLSMSGLGVPAGEGFGHSFGGGMLHTCGLSHIGPAIDSQPMHGRIHHRPAQSRCASVSGDKIRLSGEMRESALFGASWRLKREWIFPLGQSRMLLRDTVTNLSAQSQTLLILYHINLGHPFLSEALSLRFPAGTQTFPATSEASAALKDIARMTAPSPDAPELDYHHLLPAGQGYAAIRAVNPELNIAMDLRYAVDELPWLVEWKYLRQGEYVLGLEPANNRVESAQEARQHGRGRLLAPGERCTMQLEIAFSPCITDGKG